MTLALLIGLAVIGGAPIVAQGPIYTRMAEILGGSIPAAFLAFVSAPGRSHSSQTLWAR